MFPFPVIQYFKKNYQSYTFGNIVFSQKPKVNIVNKCEYSGRMGREIFFIDLAI